ncbi:MAG: hypothetical protein JXA90_03155 [Planctomycetes bacterium]|nr:hypothetical protein [Planctomycetota bacterium]
MSDVIRALALLANESWDEANPGERDPWRAIAGRARAEYDQLRSRAEAAEAALRTALHARPTATEYDALTTERDRLREALRDMVARFDTASSDTIGVGLSEAEAAACRRARAALAPDTAKEGT